MNRYIDKVDVTQLQQVNHSPFLADLTHLIFNISTVAISKKTKLERDVSEIAYDVTEMIFDTSAKWPETLAEPPKPLANWSLAKRRNVIASVASWAFEKFLGKIHQIPFPP